IFVSVHPEFTAEPEMPAQASVQIQTEPAQLEAEVLVGVAIGGHVVVKTLELCRASQSQTGKSGSLDGKSLRLGGCIPRGGGRGGVRDGGSRRRRGFGGLGIGADESEIQKQRQGQVKPHGKSSLQGVRDGLKR